MTLMRRGPSHLYTGFSTRSPANAPGLLEAVGQQRQLKSPLGAVHGKNSKDEAGYMGPSPPRGHGVHHYRFHLYAWMRL